jgi:uncharacterized DUF497 family protein
MTITFDPAKRAATLTHRGLDFAGRCAGVRGRPCEDDRFDYAEVRQITAGLLDGRMIVFVWTARGSDCHVISMRYCHAKEERKIRRRFGL